jgi:hypothetical protein
LEIIISFYYTLVNNFPEYFQQILAAISHNVPAVYDVFAARIRACEARPGLQKCGGVLAWEWSEAE